LNLLRNLQQSDCYIAQHTLNLLLHYLVKMAVVTNKGIFILKQYIQLQ